jgi:hypothetical protein
MMDYDGLQWITVDYDGLQWITMDYDGLRWITMDYNGLRRITMDSDGLRWITMDYDGLRWLTMDYNGLLLITWILADHGLLSIPKPPKPLRPSMTARRHGAGMAHTIASRGHGLSWFMDCRSLADDHRL